MTRHRLRLSAEEKRREEKRSKENSTTFIKKLWKYVKQAREERSRDNLRTVG